MVLDLLFIGLGITPEPFPLTAFVLIRMGRRRKPPAWMAGTDRLYLLVS